MPTDSQKNIDENKWNLFIIVPLILLLATLLGYFILSPKEEMKSELMVQEKVEEVEEVVMEPSLQEIQEDYVEKEMAVEEVAKEKPSVDTVETRTTM